MSRVVRTFNGKKYTLATRFRTKAGAKADAKAGRKRGFLARVVKSDSEYQVRIHPK